MREGEREGGRDRGREGGSEEGREGGRDGQCTFQHFHGHHYGRPVSPHVVRHCFLDHSKGTRAQVLTDLKLLVGKQPLSVLQLSNTLE